MGGVTSGAFSVVLDAPAVAAVSVAVTSSKGGDVITSTPVVIPAGSSGGTFTLTPVDCGSRNISISSPPLAVVGSPHAYNSLCNCPDDTGTNNRSTGWVPTISCPPTFSIDASFTPTQLWEVDLYCTTGLLLINITE
jgi:hypothetical protein